MAVPFLTSAKYAELFPNVDLSGLPATDPGSGKPWVGNDGLQRVGAAPYPASPAVNVMAYGPAGDGVTDDTAAFVAAATAAVAAGQNYIFAPAAPGGAKYHCPGMTCDDMSEVYIVGDAKFTPTTFVAAFSEEEIISRAVAQHRSPKNGNGMIAIEVDDALDDQWETLFPFCKELGIVLGVAWPTSNGQQWLKEVYRHGWELIAHGATHAQFADLTEAEMEEECRLSRDAIAAITGSNDDIAFIFPGHSTNATAIKVAKKYFTRGRYIANVSPQSRDEPSLWDVSAIASTTWLDNGLTDETKALLRQIAATDGRAVFYFHYLSDSEATRENLREFVEYVRYLGISIELPKRVCGDACVSEDPYFENVDRWAVTGTGWSWDTGTKFHGTRSLKFHHTGAGFGSYTVRTAGKLHVPVSNAFYAARISFRYKADANVLFPASYSAGIHLRTSGTVRTIENAQAAFGVNEIGFRLPASGTTLPAADWSKQSFIHYIQPDRRYFFLYLYITNINEGQGPFWIDDFRVDLLDMVSTIRGSVALNGTTGVPVYPGINNFASCGVTLTAKASTAGTLYYTTANEKMTIFSSNAADTTQTVEYSITPGISYSSLS